MRHVPLASREDQGARRRGSGGASRDSSSADELGEAIEPGLLSLRRGAVLQQLLRHEERSCRAGWPGEAELCLARTSYSLSATKTALAV